MTTSNFMIGPVKEGLRRDLRPFATPEDSFTELTNAYQFRGRIIRRPGYRKLGVLANGTPVMGLRTQEEFAIQVQNLIAFDTTNAYLYSGGTFIALPSVMTTVWSGTDYQFFYSENYAGSFWATNSKAGLHGVAVSNAVAGVGITNITTSSNHGFTTGQTVTFINLGGTTDLNGNTYVITVTGLNTFSIPYQTTKIYTTGGMALNSQVSITGQDGIRYYGILTNGTGWANYNPPISTTLALAGALLIFAYRGYLVFLNTTEGNEAGVFNYGNRARWTQIGTPYYSAPAPISPDVQGIDTKAARDDLFGRGGANDAPTNEVIVAAGFIRDILVVYFERSTWRLRFVNNVQNPFVWERVNIDLGSDCTFSTIRLNKGLMAIGNRGIVVSDGNDTLRFDEKIPDDIFDIRQENFGLYRVYGIRTFTNKLIYWTFPDAISNANGTYPDKVLVYNYETQNWSFFDDCFTCFGYFYNPGTATTWASLTQDWSTLTSQTWGDGSNQSGYESIIAGNQQGYVFELEKGGTVNSASLSISAITAASPGVFTSTNNNLQNGTWITLTGITGITSSDGVSLNGRNFKISKPLPTDNDFTISEYKAVDGGAASGTSYTYTLGFTNIIQGSAQIDVGSIKFLDPNVDGILVGTGGVNGTGTINYTTGAISLTFNSAIASTAVWIRVVSLDPTQEISIVSTTGVYAPPPYGEIIKISGFDIQTKYFNFFGDDKRARLSKIDFYVDSTTNGQFTCNVFADSSNVPVNTPLSDNPQQNIVLTSINPYQVGQGAETIYRLYCDCLAQTLQLQLTLSDAQLATNSITKEDFKLLAMLFTLRRGGRLP